MSFLGVMSRGRHNTQASGHEQTKKAGQQFAKSFKIQKLRQVSSGIQASGRGKRLLKPEVSFVVLHKKAAARWSLRFLLWQHVFRLQPSPQGSLEVISRNFGIKESVMKGIFWTHATPGEFAADSAGLSDDWTLRT